MSDGLKLKKEEIEAIKALGVVSQRKGGPVVTIPLSVLDSLAVPERTRVDRDTQREQFHAVVSKYTTDPDGIVWVPLADFVRTETRPDAPFTPTTAQQQSTWAGRGRGSRYAFDLYKRKTRVDTQFNFDTGAQYTRIAILPMTEAEIVAYSRLIESEDAKKQGKQEPPATPAPALQDEPTPVPAVPDLSGRVLEPVKA